MYTHIIIYVSRSVQQRRLHRGVLPPRGVHRLVLSPYVWFHVIRTTMLLANQFFQHADAVVHTLLTRGRWASRPWWMCVAVGENV